MWGGLQYALQNWKSVPYKKSWVNIEWGADLVWWQIQKVRLLLKLEG